MNKITGTYFDGHHPVGSAATLIWSGAEASIIGAHALARHPLRALRISPRIGSADRFISFPGGAQLQCGDDVSLDTLPQEGATEGTVAWLEQRWWMALLGIVLVGGIVGFGYFYGLPRLAEFAAARIPLAAERDMGDTSVRWLDKRGFFAPSKVACDSQLELRAEFAEVVRGLPNEADYRLLFRNAPGLGANAVALPGGIIVITDDMMKMAASPDEALAVLAHEAGHVALRHTLRHALQDSAVAAAIAAVTGDAASLTSAVAGLPAALAQASYSRDFEVEADAFALELLQRQGISPENFARVMEKLERKQKAGQEGFGFLASHPPTPERIARARAAGGAADQSQPRYPAEAPWPRWSERSDCL